MNGPSFRFRLERVRALRERKEDAAKLAMAGAVQEHHRYQERLRQAEDRVTQARDAQLAAATASATAHELVAHQAFLERVESAQRSSRSELDRHAVELEHCRQELSAAARDREALERLKEHQRADHAREAARQEGQLLDEIAIEGFRRRAA
jgi:flagellar protein FliJ